MISLEQVNLLEVRVANAIDYVKQVNEENAALKEEKAALLKKLEVNQKRIDELEVLVMSFKEDQGRIEDGIIAALDRLSQFEEAFESSLSNGEKTSGRKISSKPRDTGAREAAAKETSPNKEVFFEIPAGETSKASASSGELEIF